MKKTNEKLYQIILHIFIPLCTVLVVFLAWYIVTKNQMVNPLFLPAPQKVWEAFLSTITDGYKSNSLWQHLGASLERIIISFLLAIATAVPLGLASGYIPFLKRMLEPIIEFIRPLPPLAYYTLIVIWLGIDNESKIMLLTIACFTPIYVSCSSAVMRIPQNYLRNAEALGANKFQVFTRVIMPFTLPDTFSGMRIALGVGYTTLVSSEIVAARSGIGWMVLDASKFLRSDIIFVGIIVMGITGILMDQILRLIKKLCLPWEGKDF